MSQSFRSALLRFVYDSGYRVMACNTAIFSLIILTAISVSASDHYAFKAPQPSPQPTIKNTTWPKTPIDHFILSRLEQSHLTPSPEASKQILIRRLTFDLLGLPPTPKEVADFLSDSRPDAYERLVDRLLASPHYGERWGRHWLDAAGYADSNGYFDADSDRPLAYKYRDYVIRSLNADKPFDQFIREQLAGDELAGFNPEADLPPEKADLLIATHFLRNAPDGTGESDGNAAELAADRYAVLEGNVQIIGSALLGLTVQCARCHNHKFEPISQQEYYSLQAILKPAYDHDHWLKPAERIISIGTKAERDQNKQQLAAFDRDLAALKEARDGVVKPFAKLVRDEALAKLAPEERALIQKALDTKEKERDEGMKALLKKHDAVLNPKDADLVKRFPDIADAYTSLTAALKKKESQRPAALPQIAALTESTIAPAPHQLLSRGNYQKPLRTVEPGIPAILTTADNLYRIVTPPSQTTGRRLAFANWLVHPSHPTFARLSVNRIWQHHFGRGLVATADNLGVTSPPPTHPELLDYLATELIRSGWHLKSLHRLIVTSAIYRQSSSRDDGAARADPDNLLLWHFPLQRLDAESLRDAMLSASGELEEAAGGPYVPTKRDPTGQVYVEESQAGAHRRSIYLQQRRTQPATILDVFDTAQMNPNCTRRNPSTVALQSLTLLNSDFSRQRSKHFAQRLLRESTTDDAARLNLAFLLTVARPPTEAERSASLQFLQSQRAIYKNGEESAWTDLCQMLFASNAFLYVD